MGCLDSDSQSGIRVCSRFSPAMTPFHLARSNHEIFIICFSFIFYTFRFLFCSFFTRLALFAHCCLLCLSLVVAVVCLRACCCCVGLEIYFVRRSKCFVCSIYTTARARSDVPLLQHSPPLKNSSGSSVCPIIMGSR